MKDFEKWLIDSERYTNINSVADNEGNKSHIYWSDDLLYYCVIAPHSGNDYKYILRVNAQKTFDRWSVCEFQLSFETLTGLITFLIESKTAIYKSILSSILDYYIEDPRY